MQEFLESDVLCHLVFNRTNNFSEDDFKTDYRSDWSDDSIARLQKRTYVFHEIRENDSGYGNSIPYFQTYSHRTNRDATLTQIVNSRLQEMNKDIKIR